MSESGAEPGHIAAQIWRHCIERAILAPSSHNTQPWCFRIRRSGVELYADRSRRLPVCDPLDRELIMSCGASLYNLRIALAHAGFDAAIERFPDATEPDLLARIRATGQRVTRAREHALYDAIDDRHTNRQAFGDTAVPKTVIDECRAAADEQGGWFRVVRLGEDREALAKLVMHADHLQRASPQFRKELAAWLRSNDAAVTDGMPGYSIGLGDLSARIAPLVVRTFDLGDGQAASDLELVAGSPLIALLGSANESTEAWLRAGEALEAVALTCTMHGVSMSYLNQAVEETQTRSKLGLLVGEHRPVQLVLRIGFGPPARPTPRRPVEEVLI